MPKWYSNKFNFIGSRKQIAKIKTIIEADSFCRIVGKFNLLDLIGLPKTIAKKISTSVAWFSTIKV